MKIGSWRKFCDISRVLSGVNRAYCVLKALDLAVIIRWFIATKFVVEIQLIRA